MTIAADNMTRPETTLQVLDLFRTQASLYARLETLAARQRQLIVEDDAGRLMAVLAERRRLTESLSAIGRQLAPVREEWAGWSLRFTPPQREEADRLVADAERRLRGLMDADDHDCRLLAAKKETASRALRTAHSGSRAMSAYRPAPAQTAGRFDSGSEEA